MPAEIITRKKRGFANPVARWMRGPLASYFDDLVFHPRSLTRRYLSPTFVRGLVEADRAGRADHKRRLFLLLSLELWHRRFIG